MTTLLWALVVGVTLLRAAAGFSVPMTGDEAYYWEWSRHPALGYVDHPPMVAWVIAAFSLLGTTPGAVRVGFVLCGIVATLAAADCATTLSDRRAGAVAAAVVTLAPLLSLAFTSATPDGPYLAWSALTLALAARAFRAPSALLYAALGVAMGGALLSRLFALALVAGIAAFALVPSRRSLWRAGLGWSMALALMAYAPFLWWNATHEWASFVFALAQRHRNIDPVSLVRPFVLFAIAAAAFSPGLWIAAFACVVRPPRALLGWTAVPLLAALFSLAIKENVEVYWLEGPFLALAIAAGVAYVALAPRARTIWAIGSAVPALAFVGALFVAALVPGPVYAALRTHGLQLRHAGPFEIYTFPELARDVRRIVRNEPGTIVMTDGYGFSSLLDFNAGIAPVVIGYDVQGQESRRWYSSSEQPERALFVDKESLYTDPGRPDFLRRLHRACTTVRPGPTLNEASYPGVPVRPYYTTWCEGLVPGGLRLLRWEADATARGEKHVS